jgi:hypothetical protein
LHSSSAVARVEASVVKVAKVVATLGLEAAAMRVEEAVATSVRVPVVVEAAAMAVVGILDQVRVVDAVAEMAEETSHQARGAAVAAAVQEVVAPDVVAQVAAVQAAVQVVARVVVAQDAAVHLRGLAEVDKVEVDKLSKVRLSPGRPVPLHRLI